MLILFTSETASLNLLKDIKLKANEYQIHINYVDTSNTKLCEEYGVTTSPTLVVISRDGYSVDKYTTYKTICEKIEHHYVVNNIRSLDLTF